MPREVNQASVSISREVNQASVSISRDVNQASVLILGEVSSAGFSSVTTFGCTLISKILYKGS